MTPANVYLARHGQTAYNLERRFQGHLPVPLDDTGREQAADLAERASAGAAGQAGAEPGGGPGAEPGGGPGAEPGGGPGAEPGGGPGAEPGGGPGAEPGGGPGAGPGGIPFRVLWCSPLLRARETADIVGARLGLEPREEPRLKETDAGDWTDRLFTDVQAEDPNGFAGFIEGRPDFAFPGGESFAAQGERVAAALADVEAGDLPALVVCHGVVIRIALYQRAGHRVALAERVPNAALVPLDPEEAEHAALGGGEALPPS